MRATAAPGQRHEDQVVGAKGNGPPPFFSPAPVMTCPSSRPTSDDHSGPRLAGRGIAPGQGPRLHVVSARECQGSRRIPPGIRLQRFLSRLQMRGWCLPSHHARGSAAGGGLLLREPCGSWPELVSWGFGARSW
jgi:hypothetical protein